MHNELDDVVRDLKPESTILFFGAGSSIPSHAPSVATIISHLGSVFRQHADGLTLAELSELIEHRTKDRRRIITEVKKLFEHLRPTGGLLNVPLYDWKSIYTTNYDELIEHVYEQRKKDLVVYSSNFDFGVRGHPNATRLFKLHGTIGKDISTGQNQRLILTELDYENTREFREHLFISFEAELAESNLIIIGHSLTDPDIRDIVARAMKLNAEAKVGGRITLLMYEPNENRAALYKGRGLKVVFAGIDEFFAALARRQPTQALPESNANDPLSNHPRLRAVTIDVDHECQHAQPDVSRLFNGWPATYADICAGLTFMRTVSDHVVSTLCDDKTVFTVIVGASGVGKTTAVRQSLVRLKQEGFVCWEHRGDNILDTEEWIAVAAEMNETDTKGVLFIDDASSHLHEVNDLVDSLASRDIASLKIVSASGRNNWRPRVKSPNLYKFGKEVVLSRLDRDEIEKLMTLVDSKEDINRLVENTFSGFSRHEKRRRLVERCESDMFVCMRNIFSTEAYDDIILREYANLDLKYQVIYRLVSALESAGIRVHRQLVLRLLNIPPTSISDILENLTDIVTEYTLDSKNHIYGWRGRHPVINDIITRYKFANIDDTIELFEKVIANIVPTYDVEIRSIRELCSVDSGIQRIPDKHVQNRLLRRMASVAPGERVPRHRLIRNLIEMGEFDQAHTEIRIFEKDFGTDGPVGRYRIDLTVARAVRTPGILTEDRVAILEQARELAVSLIRRFEYTPRVFASYCEVGVEMYRLTGNLTIFDDAMDELKRAETRIGDPEVTYMVRRFERRIAGQLVKERMTEPE